MYVCGVSTSHLYRLVVAFEPLELLVAVVVLLLLDFTAVSVLLFIYDKL